MLKHWQGVPEGANSACRNKSATGCELRPEQACAKIACEDEVMRSDNDQSKSPRKQYCGNDPEPQRSSRLSGILVLRVGGLNDDSALLHSIAAPADSGRANACASVAVCLRSLFLITPEHPAY